VRQSIDELAGLGLWQDSMLAEIRQVFSNPIDGGMAGPAKIFDVRSPIERLRSGFCGIHAPQCNGRLR
jgi:hypothetical protein